MVRYAATPPAVAISSAAPTPRNTSLKCSLRPSRSRYASRIATIMLASMPSRRKMTSVASKWSPTQALGQVLGKATLMYRPLVPPNLAQISSRLSSKSLVRRRPLPDRAEFRPGQVGVDEELERVGLLVPLHEPVQGG